MGYKYPCLLFLAPLLLLLCPGIVRAGSALGQQPQDIRTGVGASSTSRNTADSRAQGSDAFRRGAFDEAVAAWKRAVILSNQSGDVRQGIELSVLIARALEALGQYGEAQKILGSVLVPVQEPTLRPQLALPLSELGDVYATTGPREKAYKYLREALQMADEQHNTRLSSAVNNNLGNLLIADGKLNEAAEAYESSIAKAGEAKDQDLTVRSLSNAAMLANRMGKPEEAQKLLDRAYKDFDTLDENHATAFVLTNIGIVYSDLAGQTGPWSGPAADRSISVLGRALAIADRIADSRAISYAAGYIGRVYENREGEPETVGTIIFRNRRQSSCQQCNQAHPQHARIGRV